MLRIRVTDASANTSHMHSLVTCDHKQPTFEPKCGHK